MTPYESLSPERFQQFCQALAHEEFPSLQFMPVGQPDGGRDALARVWDVWSKDETAAVLQVKFVRRPEKVDNLVAWLEETLDGEAPKVQRLIERGAVRYILATNLAGSAHLDVGSIDRVHALLRERFPSIATECWWRDDLDGRLLSHWSLKWSFPELFTGTDFVRLLMEARLGAEHEGAARALRAYLADQYDRDREVRFKQVELSNDLLEMFTDVPARLASTTSSKSDRRLRSWLGQRGGSVFFEDLDPLEEHVGAADLQLLAPLDDVAPRMVILGAPGQGKSTLLQYVVQVHRARLLEHRDLERIPEDHRVAPVRIPFRIELRDFASFLRGASSERDEDAAGRAPRTLEGFLASQVATRSGGARFTVDALLECIEMYPVLLALDGLDEVVQVEDRKQVVEEIAAADSRLRVNAASLVTLVTSRPLAFANSPSLSDEEFSHVHLGSLTDQLIAAYTDRWTKAHHLHDADASALTSTLQKRLRESHFRELARNPMQLAILLNLIHRLGEALPDQRTNLYRRYMDLFLDREADKSPAVRDRRELLVRLHGALAWRLQADAEKVGGVGRIEQAQLSEFAERFLQAEGWPTDLFGDLFTGAFERVGALVSRQLGTFEFEVQPVREYFAGSWLYDSAPVGPVGAPAPGTRPERFDALAQRPYWLNVLRFYAGSYSTGELASLADRIERLDGDARWTGTAHPRLIAASLTIDRTFEQDLRAADRALGIALKELGTRHSLDVGQTGQVLQTTSPSGKAELLERAVTAACDPASRGWRIGEQLQMVFSPRELRDVWASQRGALEPGRLAKLGRESGALRDVGYEELRDCFGEALWDRDVVTALCALGRWDVVDANEEVAAVANRLALDGFLAPVDHTVAHPLCRLVARVGALALPASGSSGGVLEVTGPVEAPAPHTLWATWNDALRRTQDIIETLASGSQTGRLARAALEALEPWWGDEPLARDSATFAAGIGDQTWRRKKAVSDPLDTAASLIERARFARLTREPEWWIAHLKRASGGDRVWLLGLLLRYATSDLLSVVFTNVEQLLADLPEAEFPDLDWRVRAGRGLVRGESASWILSDSWSGGRPISARALTLLKTRLRSSTYARLVGDRSPVLASTMPGVLRAEIVDSEIQAFAARKRTWAQLKGLLSDAHKAGVVISEPRASALRAVPMPVKTAASIVERAAEFPAPAVTLAEEALLIDVVADVPTVADVAARDGWFGASHLLPDASN